MRVSLPPSSNLRDGRAPARSGLFQQQALASAVAAVATQGGRAQLDRTESSTATAEARANGSGLHSQAKVSSHQEGAIRVLSHDVPKVCPQPVKRTLTFPGPARTARGLCGSATGMWRTSHQDVLTGTTPAPSSRPKLFASQNFNVSQEFIGRHAQQEHERLNTDGGSNLQKLNEQIKLNQSPASAGSEIRRPGPAPGGPRSGKNHR